MIGLRRCVGHRSDGICVAEAETGTLSGVRGGYKWGNSKSQAPNHKQIQTSEVQNSKQFDLESRTFEFARRVRAFLKTIPRTVCNIEDGRQLVKASGSVGANYIEANESLSKKDFRMRVRISRKESKESRYWLRLLDIGDNPAIARERDALVQESNMLLKILSSILRNCEK